MGVQRFLSNKDNIIREAILSASTIATATGTARPIPLDREGGGTVELTGAYTGDSDAQFDIEITDGGLGATPQASAPVLTGVGNGEMTGLSVDGSTDAQDFEVTLRIAAAAERAAEASADGLRVSALQDEGADGNGTILRVDRSALTLSATGKTAPETKPAGTIETSGPAWDFGALPLTSDGKVNPSTARISFGDDPQVYRQYAIQRNGFTVFRFVPALVREVRGGAAVYSVSGGRKVTITAGKPTTKFSARTTPSVSGNLTALAVDTTGQYFVGVTSGGSIIRSADGGLTWALASSEPFTGAINAVCYSSGRFVAGGASGALAYSADNGDTWTSVTSGFGTDAINGLAAGGGVVVAVGVSGKVSTSSDNGSTWTLQVSNACSDKDITCVAFVLDHFVAGAKDGVYASSDAAGAVWSNFSASPISSGTDWTAVAFDSGLRRLVLGTSGGELYYSDDLGTTLTAVTASPHTGNAIEALTSAVGIFAAIDDAGVISTARDPQTWTDLDDAGGLEQGAAIVGASTGVFVAADNDEVSRAVMAQIVSSVTSRYTFVYNVVAAMALLDVAENAVFDETPGGQAVREFQPVTGAIAPYIEKSRADLPALTGLAISEQAPTQAITVAYNGSTWDVTTDQGEFEASTATAFHCARVSFTIPSGSYNAGDSYTLQVLAASPVTLAGGADAVANNTWSVIGSVDGVLADYEQAPDPTPGAYNDIVNFTIEHGTIPFAVGDQFTFTIEGGKFRWRKDDGAWSAEADITSSPVSLSDGLSAVFTRASSPPSFVEDDLYSFAVFHPYGLDNLRQPNPERFAWASGSCAITADLGGSYEYDTLVIARHTIPQGATITVEGSDDGFSTTLWSETLTWREGVIRKTIAQAAVTHLRLTVNQPSAIGWWAYLPARSVTPSGKISLKRVASKRKGPITSGFVGQGTGGALSFEEGFLSQSDIDTLDAIVGWAWEHGDEPIVLCCNVDHPADDALVVLDVDEYEPLDVFNYESDQRTDRHFELAGLTLRAVIE